MKTLTKDEFKDLSEKEQAEYINGLCKANGIDPYLTIGDEIVDNDDGGNNRRSIRLCLRSEH